MALQRSTREPVVSPGIGHLPQTDSEQLLQTMTGVTFNPVGVAFGTRGFEEGVKQIGEGVRSFARPFSRYQAELPVDETGKPIDSGAASGLTQIGAGALRAGMSVASPAIATAGPVGLAFTSIIPSATELAAQSQSPVLQKTAQYTSAPATTYFEPVTKTGKSLAEIADFVIVTLTLGGVEYAVARRIGNRIKSKTTTPADRNIINQNITPKDIETKLLPQGARFVTSPEGITVEWGGGEMPKVPTKVAKKKFADIVDLQPASATGEPATKPPTTAGEPITQPPPTKVIPKSRQLVVERGGDRETVSDGEAGRGVYAFLPSHEMRKYYTSQGEELHRIVLDKDRTVDLTSTNEQNKLIAYANQEFDRIAKQMPGYIKPKVNSQNIQRYGRVIEDYVNRNHPDVDAYIVGHRGPGIPTGKQVVIRNLPIEAQATELMGVSARRDIVAKLGKSAEGLNDQQLIDLAKEKGVYETPSLPEAPKSKVIEVLKANGFNDEQAQRIAEATAKERGPANAVSVAEAEKKIAAPKPAPVSTQKQPWEMTATYVATEKSKKDFPLDSKYEIRNGKPIYIHSTTVRFDGKPRTFTLESKSPMPPNVMEKLHKQVVEAALSEGKPVPPEVLKDYPDLVKEEAASLTIQRVDEQPFTVKKGDWVKAWISQDNFATGKVVGISKANNEIRIEYPGAVREGGQWFELGRIYPGEEPVPKPMKPQPKARLTSLLSKEPPGGFTEADRVSSTKPLTPSKLQEAKEAAPKAGLTPTEMKKTLLGELTGARDTIIKASGVNWKEAKGAFDSKVLKFESLVDKKVQKALLDAGYKLTKDGDAIVTEIPGDGTFQTSFQQILEKIDLVEQRFDKGGTTRVSGGGGALDREGKIARQESIGYQKLLTNVEEAKANLTEAQRTKSEKLAKVFQEHLTEAEKEVEFFKSKTLPSIVRSEYKRRLEEGEVQQLLVKDGKHEFTYNGKKQVFDSEYEGEGWVERQIEHEILGDRPEVKSAPPLRPTGTAQSTIIPGLSQEKLESAARKITESEPFKRWFGGSKVVDEKGSPKMLYSGHQNAAMYGEKFDPRKGTAGAFYATESPEIASNYSLGKLGDREYYEHGSQYRLAGKNGQLNKKLWQYELTDAQKKKLDELADLKDENGEHVYQGLSGMRVWAKDMAKYDPLARRILARPNDLQNIWEFNEQMGYNIAYPRQEKTPGEPYYLRQRLNETEEVLDALGIKWNAFDRSQPGVLPVFLTIKNPLVTSEPFPKDLLQALEQATKGERRVSPDEMRSRHWTKDYPLRNWVDDIKESIGTGEDTYWATQVPKKALPILKRFGYDGIKDIGGKARQDPHAVWIAFDAEQIKSATGNRGTFDPASPNMLQSSVLPGLSQEKLERIAQPFFSALSRAIDKLPQEKWDSIQLLGRLRNTAGVKQEEMKWTGLDDFLKSKPKVTKQEVSDYLKANEVKVEEVVKGEPKKPEWVQSEQSWYIPSTRISIERLEPNGLYRLQTPGGLFETFRSLEEAKREGEASARVEYNTRRDLGSTKFSSYQEPGAKEGSYRELLLTLPTSEVKEVPVKLKWEQQTEAMISAELPNGNSVTIFSSEDGRGPVELQVLTPDAVDVGEARQFPTIQEAKRAAASMVVQKKQNLVGGFRSSHFDEPNVLAHIRFNEREVPTYSAPEVKAVKEKVLRTARQNEFETLDSTTQKIQERPNFKRDTRNWRVRVDQDNTEYHGTRDVRIMDGDDWLMLRTGWRGTDQQLIASHWAEKNAPGLAKRFDSAYSGTTQGAYKTKPSETEVDNAVRTGVVTPREAAIYRHSEGLAGDKSSSIHRTLFIEEIQSDWHQKGRKEGYAKIEKPYRIEQNMTEGNWDVLDKDGQRLETYPTREEAQSIVDRSEKPATGVPDAPFKSTWHELAFRRAVRYAAENGYDAVSWTTGEMQNARYDLSKVLNAIEWGKNDNGTFDVQGNVKDGSFYTKRKLDAKGIEEHFGKDVAEKITSSDKDEGKLEGVDLKVGGQGMKGFYDKILVDYANKFGKKFGAKVENRKIQNAAEDFTKYTTDNTTVVGGGAGGLREFVLRSADGEDLSSMSYGDGLLYPSSVRHQKLLQLAYQMPDIRTRGEASVHSLPITPEMKRSALSQGMELFSSILPGVTNKQLERLGTDIQRVFVSAANKITSGEIKPEELREWVVAALPSNITQRERSISREIASVAQSVLEHKKFVAEANLSQFEQPEKIRKDIGTLSAEEVQRQRRGVRTHEMTVEAAGERPDVLEAALAGRIKPGRALNADEQYILASEIARRSEARVGEPSSEDIRLIKSWLGARAEIGRGLESFKIKVDPKVAEFIRKVDPTAELPVRIPPGIFEKIAELARNAKLAALSGLVRSAVGNTTMQLFKYPELVGEITLNKVSNAVAGHGANRSYREVATDFLGFKSGLREGFKIAWETVKENQKAVEENVFLQKETGRPEGAIGGKAGVIIRTPQRLQGAIDAVLRIPSARAYLGRAAARKAFAEGLKNEQWMNRVHELTLNPTSEMVAEAATDARYRTFQSELGALGRGVNALRLSHPVVQWFVPFFNTPANLFKALTERTPFAPFTPSFAQAAAEAFSKPGFEFSPTAMRLAKTTGRSFDQNSGMLYTKLSRMATGTAFMAATGVLISKVLDGEITGRGPKSDNERDALRRTGWQPYSIRLGDIYISYKGFEPITGMLSTLADLGEGYKDSGISGAVYNATKNFAANFADNPFLTGMGDAIDVINDPESGKVDRIVAGFATGMVVPTIAKQARYILDPTVRKPEGMVEAFKAQVPITTKGILPKRNVFGETVEIEKPATRIAGVITTTRKSSTLENELQRLDLTLDWPSKMIEGVELTPEQHDRYIQVAGSNFKKALEAIVNSDAYKMLTDGMKESAIRTTQDNIRQLIRVQLFPYVYLEGLGNKTERNLTGGAVSQEEKDRTLKAFRRAVNQ